MRKLYTPEGEQKRFGSNYIVENGDEVSMGTVSKSCPGYELDENHRLLTFEGKGGCVEIAIPDSIWPLFRQIIATHDTGTFSLQDKAKN